MEPSVKNKTDSSPRPSKATDTRKEDIQFRAYQIYLARNRQAGHELDDWLQAERELVTRN
jgi:hypothetical protein